MSFFVTETAVTSDTNPTPTVPTAQNDEESTSLAPCREKEISSAGKAIFFWVYISAASRTANIGGIFQSDPFLYLCRLEKLNFEGKN